MENPNCRNEIVDTARIEESTVLTSNLAKDSDVADDCRGAKRLRLDDGKTETLVFGCRDERMRAEQRILILILTRAVQKLDSVGRRDGAESLPLMRRSR